MQNVATTRLSSKGQVVIPEVVRERLGLRPGVQFVVTGEGDVVILKVIAAPARSEFGRLVTRIRAQARRAGLRRADVGRAVKATRSKG